MKTRLLIATAAAFALLAFQAGPVLAQTDDNYGFDIVDPGGKGFVTLDEFMAAFQDKAQAQANFTAMDANGDGILTKDEFLIAQGKK
jgi:hypothetical protein